MKINPLQQSYLIIGIHTGRKKISGFYITWLSLVNKNTGDLVDPLQDFRDMWSCFVIGFEQQDGPMC